MTDQPNDPRPDQPSPTGSGQPAGSSWDSQAGSGASPSGAPIDPTGTYGSAQTAPLPGGAAAGGYGPPGGYSPPPSSPYGAPGGGYPPSGTGGASPISGGDAKGFFAALFDFSFTSFATAKIVKFVYVLIVIATGLAYLFYVLVGFKASAGLGVFVLLIIGPIMVVVILAVWRMTLEFYLGVARMSEDIRVIKMRDRGL